MVEEKSAKSRDPAQRRYGHLADAAEAAATKDPEAIAFMAGWGHDLDARNKDGCAALHVAAENGDETTTRALLEHGASAGVIGLFGLTPAHVASYCGHIGVLELLFANGGVVRV